MKKTYIMISVVVVIVSLTLVLNISVSTKQGINYQVHEIKLPLYLKALDFIDRHYNYKNLVSNILGPTKDEDTRMLKLLEYVHSNVRKNPEELPVIDDHPLNILIRGYGVQDQFEDIFTILCTYAGMEAFFEKFESPSGKIYNMSFVKIKGKWSPVSAYAGTYAIKGGAVASMDDILQDRALLTAFTQKLPNFEPGSFMKDIEHMDFGVWSTRVKGQSPAGRLSCIIKNMFKHNKYRISK